MPNENPDIGISIKDFVRQSLKEIIDALEGEHVLQDAIEFDLSVATTRMGEGGIELRVVNFGADIPKEMIQRVKFKIKSPSPKEKDVAAEFGGVAEMIDDIS